ncbi:MAG: xanthine dehydrogenase family protein subunit M [Actinobacteria bacterium]|nr:xanthine dehydrogenase family protein subunit M [Actinomycetota bacterium]
MTVATPSSLREALEFRRANQEALVIAGGTDLMVEVNFNRRKVDDVLSLTRVNELRNVEIDGRSVRIGAATPWSVLETGEVSKLLPALAEAARTVGSPQIRQAGTIGGNLGTCSPAGDGLPVLAALNATIVVGSVGGSRSIPFVEFMKGPKRNDLRGDELIVAVDIPLNHSWQGYSKVGVRNAMVISVASACLAVSLDKKTVSIALGAVGPTIIRCTETENWIAGQGNDVVSALRSSSLRKELGERAAQEARPISDHRSTAEYRRHAIGVIVSRLAERATHE